MKRWLLLLVPGCALLSCARESPPIGATTPSPPGVRYEAHLAAGGTPPHGGTLSNPHAGDASGWVGPDLADRRWRYGGSDAEVFSSIYYGRPKGMPAFGGVLGTEGVWTLVTYLRSLPAPADVPTESWIGDSRP